MASQIPSHPFSAFSLKLLTESDGEDVLAFERRNRDFFAQWVGDRGDEWFATFFDRHAALAEENRDGTSLLYLVRDAGGCVIGRVNILDVDGDVAELGYRLAESAQGRGIATAAVDRALSAAFAVGVRRVDARVFADNGASQRVLDRNGFVLAARPCEINGVPARLYRWRRD